MTDYKLCIFDRDGTLIEPASGERFPKDRRDWQWMHGRTRKVGQLCRQGIKVAIATNQAGPLWREATGQDKYPTVQSLAATMLVQLIGFMQCTRINTLWCVSLYDQKAIDLINKNNGSEHAEDILTRLKNELHEELQEFNIWVSVTPSWRKPNPGMLDFAMSHYGTSKEETLFVGDRQEDKLAAEAAGTDFEWSWSYFGDV